MSALLTGKMCLKAWEAVEAAVVVAADTGIANKCAGTVVVLDPQTDEPLFAADVDVKHPDAEKYRVIAHAKAELSARTGMSSRDVQQNAPHLYEDGDVKYGGSVWRDGLVVAFSGVQAVIDEAFAGMMADLLVGMCQDKVTRKGGIMDSDLIFIEA